MKNKTIAFIPVRGGSKSITLKNIKLFCGKPLVYWNIKALQACKSINTIIIATDSQVIKQTVIEFDFNKVEIYNRSSKNSSDESTTESVMIEYISKSKEIKPNDIFVLVQATSPLTRSEDFSDAIEYYKINDYDSILSGVRSHRFLWNFNGTPKNYDYNNRPRRQDFRGDFMENGAFYISKVSSILNHNNRISGKIGLFEMPSYSSYELDEPDDWIIMENLMFKHIINKKFSKKEIKLFISDVDGVMTDAGMYYTEKGDEIKKFNTHDGMAFQILRDSGIKTAIITSENTEIVKNRAVKLKVDFLYQGKQNEGKLGAAKQICKEMGISLGEVAYIGDDINCFELLNNVGVKACPSNARSKIKQIPGIIHLKTKGGRGAVREFIDYLELND
jgi:YrbI family 3-deoxy-D-manno-octulosonate 8-phosphate phosphatase